MKHPLVNKFNYNEIKNLINLNEKELESFLEKNKKDGLANEFLLLNFFFKKISTAGLPHIQSDSNIWKSSVSKETLKKIDFEYFKIPFQFFSVIIDEYLYCIVDFNLLKETYSDFKFKTAKSVSNGFLVFKASNERFDGMYVVGQDEFLHYIDNFGEDLFSLLLYVSTFKNDTSRVSKPKKIKSKKSKDIPEHRYSLIKLTQPINNRQGYSTDKQKSNKTWIVRGHWRQQKYKDKIKPKWIDSYWKGNGKNIIQSIYKV